MFNLRQIERNNRSTFYNFSTGKRQSIRLRLALTGVFSALFASTLNSNPDNFLSAVLAVESILVGFSFSVLFFLLSGHTSIDVDENVIEDTLMHEKLQTLSKEIFYNVSYFNTVSLGCVVLALILLFPSSGIAAFFSETSSKIIAPNILNIIVSISDVVKWSAWWLFFYLLCESMYTFMRTVGRVTYYFDRKLSHATGKD